MGQETFSETLDTAFEVSEVWPPLHPGGNLNPHLSLFLEKCSNHRAVCWYLGVRSCPVVCVRKFTGVQSSTPLCLHVFFKGLKEPSPTQTSPALWAQAGGIPRGWTLPGWAPGMMKGSEESNTFSSFPGQSECKQWFSGRTKSLTPHQIAFEVVVSMFGEKAKSIATQKFCRLFRRRVVENKTMQMHLVKGEKEEWSITPPRWLPHHAWN